jgi:hypothetical protein
MINSRMFICLIAALALIESLNLAEAKSVSKIKVPENFDYSMVRPVNVSVDVVGPMQGFSGLSFYTQPKKSTALRLLETGVSEADGHYTTTLMVPGYTKNIIVAARLQDHRGQKKMSIKRDQVVGIVKVK